MNYLLVMPKKLSKGASTTSIIFPLGIAYVSAAMKQAGLAVFTANLDFPEGDTNSVLHRMFDEHKIDVVCTGGLSMDCHKIKDLIDTARQIKPDIITVVGGGIISSDPETAMNVLDADIGVIGEGEVTMCELAGALNSGSALNDVPGLIIRNIARSLTTTAIRKEIKDLDSIPFPDLDGFNYGEWVKFFGGSGMVLSDRSCPMRCTFCFHPTGETYRQRSLDNIFEEIDIQYRKYGLQHLVLSSELFATSKPRVEEFCRRIRPYNVKWSGCLRVSFVDTDLLRQIKESGCDNICFGLESADDSVLKSMRKGITVEQIERALNLSYEVGISTEACNFIFGDINETKETVKNTLDFWWRYNYKTHINLALIQTFPGTYLYEYACNNGIITNKEQFLKDGCPIINVSKLTDSEFKELTSLITELRLHPHVPAPYVELTEILKDEWCKIEFKCLKCGTKNSIKMQFWFTETCHCMECGTKNEVDAFRCACLQEDRFLQSLPKDEPVLLWGAGGLYYKLMQQYGALASDRFILVDGNNELTGLSICKKTVYAPDIIAKNNIKNIIITALSRKDDICGLISGDYPSVTHVFVPSIEIFGADIVPILVPFSSVNG